MRDGVSFSISLPIDIADFLDGYCETYHMKRSHVVAEALRRMQEEESQPIAQPSDEVIARVLGSEGA